MIMKYITIIPAQKGLKRIKNKNLKLLNDYPLIYFTLKSGQNSKKLMSKVK